MLLADPIGHERKPTGMKACVVYATRYGNTEKVARSLEVGIKAAGIETACSNFKDVPLDSLNQFDLLCVGAPTEWRSASKPIKGFLDGLRGTRFHGMYGFAFDTALTRPLSGSGGKYIENELKSLGLQIIEQRQSAVVFLQNGSTSGAWLKQGEEERFEQIGRRVGTTLTTKSKAVPA